MRKLYRCRLGCILLKMPAISMRTGGYFEGLHGRLHCGNFAVFVYLSDVDVGDGGLLVVRSTALCSRSS